MQLNGIIFSWLAIVVCTNARVIDFANAVQQFSLEDPDLVIQANEVATALAHRGRLLGEGNFGKTYEVEGGINGQPAVIKSVQVNPQYPEVDGPEEARNLWTVDQLLGWGRDIGPIGGKGLRYYFVMKNMGVSEQFARKKLGMGDPSPLIKAAVKRYADQFHMQHSDRLPGNFVYHRVDEGKKGKKGKPVWQAEIIDWHNAIWLGAPGKQPVNPLSKEMIPVTRLPVVINAGKAQDRVDVCVTVHVNV